MDNPIPRGPEHLNCPDWQKPMSEVCHKCPLWTHIRGSNPNTGEDVNRWSCAKAMAPLLQIEGNMQTRQLGAAIESFRNEMVKYNQLGLQQQYEMQAQQKVSLLARAVRLLTRG